MNRESRRQATGPRLQRSRSRIGLESLESRQLLSSEGTINPDLIPSLLYRRVEPDFPVVGRGHPIGQGPGVQTLLDNDGKVITGQLPSGDEFSITVHGPGVAIVTDTTPNDGLLNSEIDTIQLVGTDLRRTYVTGQVKASDRVITDGTIGFNRLVAADGVASVVLNGFILRRTGAISTGTPRIALLGGARTLAFHAVEAFTDPTSGESVDIIIGDPTTPLRVKPNIRIDHIFNTAFDPTLGPVNDVPQTVPTVRILVNGEIHALELGSATANPVPADLGAVLSPVGYTGRTSVEALGVRGAKVVGAARNLTFSRTGQPFANRFSGMNRVGHAHFGGNADAVAIDATNGEIGQVKFLRGLGNPTGTRDTLLDAGIPVGESGYPAAGLSGGVIAARRLGRGEFGPANLVRQIPPDPNTIQSGGPGTVNYVTRPGNAMTNATVASAGSIGNTTVVGDLRNTLVASGFDYIAFRNGLRANRQASRIANYDQRGDMVDAVVAATYDSVDGVYGNGNDVAGRGAIAGNLRGNLYLSEGDDLNAAPSGNPRIRGAGFFARRLAGYLPSIGGEQEQAPRRDHSVLVRT